MDLIQRRAGEVVGAVLSGRNLDSALAEARQQEPSLDDSGRAALQDICYGTLRALGAVDYLLDRLLQRPAADIAVKNLLRIALYQLRSTRAGPHAVVDHAVRATAGIGKPAAKGLVNAVLRNYLRRREELESQDGWPDTARYSYPQWWIDRIRGEYREHGDSILSAGNRHPPMTLRVNTRVSTPDAYRDLLQQHGISAARVGIQGLILERPCPIVRLPDFSVGAVSVQDAGAQAAAHLLDLSDGLRVLDACAAPGGKSAHMLELADVHLLALDNDATRLQRVQDNLTRLNLYARVLCGDAANPDGWWDGTPFDRILADVPCTASGVVRRHPDIKWLRRPGDIAAFAERQAAMLDKLWQLLARGGKLLYATCSIFHEENGRQIQNFVQRHADGRRLAIPASDGLPIHSSGQIFPDDRHDGFFYALLEKA